MKWRIELSQGVDKFLDKNEDIDDEDLSDIVVQALRVFQGEEVNIDIKKLKGKWRGFYRIRKGKIRIVVEFNFQSSAVFIERVDFRGNVYK